MLKVLLIAGQLGGGGAERQLSLFLEHAGESIEPSCLLLNKGGIWQEPVRRMCARFHVARWNAPPLRELEFFRLVRKWRPHLIHCWHAFPFVYPLASKPFHGLPIVVNVRGDLTVDSDSGRKGLPWYYRMLRSVDIVVSNSANSLESLERVGVRLRSSCVIVNGIEMPDTAAVRLPEERLRVVGVGSLRPIKNWSQLIRVCGALAGAGQALTLEILGEGSQRAELEAQCAECGLDPAATLPGYVSDVRKRLREADVLAHCSLSEGLPNAILEGLSEGLTVVASDLNVCRELQVESGCLDLFALEDDAALRRALERLIANPSLRRERSESGREFIRRNFDCGEMARRYIEVYESLSGSSLR